jgi:hypothetical protein
LNVVSAAVFGFESMRIIQIQKSKNGPPKLDFCFEELEASSGALSPSWRHKKKYIQNIGFVSDIKFYIIFLLSVLPMILQSYRNAYIGYFRTKKCEKAPKTFASLCTSFRTI